MKIKIIRLALYISAFLLIPVFLISQQVAADPIVNPTHFDDTYWYWPSNPSGYTEMSTDITPIVDGSPDGYYFSSYYWFSGDYPATGGYLGLQTEGTQPTGKIAIFSIWGATSSSGPGYNGSGTESGEAYYTSRINYPWVINNTYKLSINLSSQSGGSETWSATIDDLTTNTFNLIGNIVVPSSRGNLYDISNTFHERYSGATTSCSDMQESEVEFTNLTASNGSISPTSHYNTQPSTGCNGDYATKDIPGGIETIIGGQFSSPTPTPTPTPVPPSTPSISSTTPTTLNVPTTVATDKTTTPTKVPLIASITITIFSAKNRPVANAKITLNGKSGETNANGQVTFNNVRTGNYYVIVESSGEKQQFKLVVKSSSSSQHISFKLANAQTSLWPEMLIGLVILISIFVASTLRLIPKFRNKPKLNMSSIQQPITQANNFAGPNPIENRPSWQQEVSDNLNQNENEQPSNQVVVNEKPPNVVNNQVIVNQHPAIIHPTSQTSDSEHSSNPD